MAKTLISDGLVNWQTPTDYLSNALTMRAGDGLLFFVDMDGAGFSGNQAYLNVIAVLSTNYGTLRSPLLLKFFPNGVTGAFFFVLPDARFGNNIDVRFFFRPKQFTRGGAPDGDIDITLSYEDSVRFKPEECTWGSQV